MKYVLPVFMLIVLVSACSKEHYSHADSETILLHGTIEKQGITFYQYGSHVLIGDGYVYALTTDRMDLNFYIGTEVEIRGTRIAGYPQEDGPDYIRVLAIHDLR